jgi:hypothetical protein
MTRLAVAVVCMMNRPQIEEGEATMWTVVIVVLIASPSAVGAGLGASTAISSLDFQTQAKCEEAAKALSTQSLNLQSPNGAEVAVYRIRATCIAR